MGSVCDSCQVEIEEPMPACEKCLDGDRRACDWTQIKKGMEALDGMVAGNFKGPNQLSLLQAVGLLLIDFIAKAEAPNANT